MEPYLRFVSGAESGKGREGGVRATLAAAAPGLPGNVLEEQGEWAVWGVVAGDSYVHRLIPHEAFMTVAGSSAPSFAAIFFPHGQLFRLPLIPPLYV